MSVLYVEGSRPLRRLFYKIRVEAETRRANMAVERAFDLGGGFLTRRPGLAAALGAALVLAFSIISYAVTYPPPAEVGISGGMAPPAVQDRREPAPAPEVSSMKDTAASPEAEDGGEGENLAAALEPAPAPFEDPVIDFSSLPKPAYSLPAPNSEAPFVLLVDKSRKRLFVLEDGGGYYSIVKRYDAALGEKRGDKQKSGDRKTPEGLYHVVGIKKDSELPAEYGPGAFVLDYPNDLDAALSKTGDGIWIHGSGLGERVAKTKGCVEINDFDIVDLDRFTDVGTPVYIFPEGFETPIMDGRISKRVVSAEVLYGVKELVARSGEKPDAVSAALASLAGGS
ncbi:MAG: L,D-transpeptidase family protein [Candidatus Nitrospinota bacterium M3_3B_026]